MAVQLRKTVVYQMCKGIGKWLELLIVISSGKDYGTMTYFGWRITSCYE
jgi:hypothetical protein